MLNGWVPDDARLLRVLLAEDAYIAREGTRRLLAESPGIEVVGVAADYDGVIETARQLRPDVVLMDIKMPPTYTMEGALMVLFEDGLSAASPALVGGLHGAQATSAVHHVSTSTVAGLDPSLAFTTA